jgi:hypothetical protein
MDIIFMIVPKTRLGKWSSGLAIVFIIGLLLALALTDNAIFGAQYYQTISIPVTIILICLSGAAVITGLIFDYNLYSMYSFSQGLPLAIYIFCSLGELMMLATVFI